MIQAVKIIVKGRVQGVGYRWYTREKARELGVNGYVRNLPNGDVEVWAEGEQQVVNELIYSLRQGPSWSQVTDVKIDEMTPQGNFNNFNVDM